MAIKLIDNKGKEVRTILWAGTYTATSLESAGYDVHHEDDKHTYVTLKVPNNVNVIRLPDYNTVPKNKSKKPSDLS